MASSQIFAMSLANYATLRMFLINHPDERKALDFVRKTVKPLSMIIGQPLVYLDGSIEDLPHVVSPLYVSLQNKRLDVFTYLLSLCTSTLVNQLLPTIDPKEVVFCYNTETLLHLACRSGQVEAIESLLARGASMDIQGCRVGTALHIAVEHIRLEVINILLDHGADIEARDGSGNTPLHVAVAWDVLDAVKRLLDRGADITATSYFGDNVYSIAITRCAITVLLYLCDRDASKMFLSESSHILTLPPPPPPLLILAAFTNRKQGMASLFNKLIMSPECPTQLKIDATLISASATVFSSRSVKRFKQALKMKKDLEGSGVQTTVPVNTTYDGQHEILSIEEWEAHRPQTHDYYIQSCIILERCVGSSHPLLYQHLAWYVFRCGYVPPMHLSFVNVLYQKCLRMLVNREELKLKCCENIPFDAKELINILRRASFISYSHVESVRLVLKGLEVFQKSRVKHKTCAFFQCDPTPSNDLARKLVHLTLKHIHRWISNANLCQRVSSGDAESRTALTQFRDLLNKFVSLSHSMLHSCGVLNVTWPKIEFKVEKFREALFFLLENLLETEAVSRVNMPDPITGVRPLHHFMDALGKKAAFLLLSHGAHLDVISRNHVTLFPGQFPASSLVGISSSTDNQLSSPIPLMCQCSHFFLKENIKYHRLNLPSRIKDYIALHERV